MAQEGNSEGFEHLYRLHSRRAYGLCLHVSRDPLEAEDFTQDAFLQAFRKIQSFRSDSLFSTWLHRLTVNIVLMGFRQRKRPKISLDEALELNEESRKPTVEFSRPDLTLNGVIDRINLVKAINQLPWAARKCFCSKTSKDTNTMRFRGWSAALWKIPNPSYTGPACGFDDSCRVDSQRRADSKLISPES